MHIVIQNKIKTALKRFSKDESGATAIEYALIAVGIAVVVGGAAATLGGQVQTLFTEIGARLAVPG